MYGDGKKKTCFVVMGFGMKTDFQTGRVLDMDKTYRVIIKKAVEAAGLECIRADDVIHSGLIDRPMYKYLHEADLVIADLSTSNVNAVYELGVRHALRPYTTIVIAESKFKFPFDLHSLLIRPYEHLGTAIDAEEAERMREELTNTIKTVVNSRQVDSPVHLFLPELTTVTRGGLSSPVRLAPPEEESSVSQLWEKYYSARAKSDFTTAKALINKLLTKMPHDSYTVQQAAFVTYKIKTKDPRSALMEARAILEPLGPEMTTDSETLGIWGAIHKRLWELDKEQKHLETAIGAYEKGYLLCRDYYNGINYAFLLDVRAREAEPMEAVTDHTLARRIRRQIVDICETMLKNVPNDEQGKPDREKIFWLRATLMEAKTGLGENVDSLIETAVKEAPESWMPETMETQLQKLRSLLAASPNLPPNVSNP